MLVKGEQLTRDTERDVLTCSTAKLRLGAPALEVGNFFGLAGSYTWPNVE